MHEAHVVPELAAHVAQLAAVHTGTVGCETGDGAWSGVVCIQVDTLSFQVRAARRSHAPQAGSTQVQPALHAQAPFVTTALGRQQLMPSPIGTLLGLHAHDPSAALKEFRPQTLTGTGGE